MLGNNAELFGGRPMRKISFEKPYEKLRQITIENLTLAFLALLLSPTVLIQSVCKCQGLPSCSRSLGSREIILIKSEWTDQRLKFTLASWLSAVRQNTRMGFRFLWKATYLITAHPSVKQVARLLAIWMEPVCALWDGTFGCGVQSGSRSHNFEAFISCCNTVRSFEMWEVMSCLEITRLSRFLLQFLLKMMGAVENTV